MPIQYRHMLHGPSLKVDLQTGAIGEGVLTFVITLAVLIIVIRGPRSPIIKNALLATSTVSLIVAGSGYTGPSMNPANFVAATQPINSLAFVFDGISSLRLRRLPALPFPTHWCIHCSLGKRCNNLIVGKLLTIFRYEEAKAKGLDNYDRDLEDTIDRLIVE
ncbi:hypothetical protein CASFOL_006504 [Castilleja foliolosa]|uniref:Aquaporin n=1 Tax=Castilleja foliolosa TaxID=1961234 RepID=A0ABD3E7K7_9LAMI